MASVTAAIRKGKRHRRRSSCAVAAEWHYIFASPKMKSARLGRGQLNHRRISARRPSSTFRQLCCRIREAKLWQQEITSQVAHSKPSKLAAELARNFSARPSAEALEARRES